jgi:hypothetical protein
VRRFNGNSNATCAPSPALSKETGRLLISAARRRAGGTARSSSPDVPPAASLFARRPHRQNLRPGLPWRSKTAATPAGTHFWTAGATRVAADGYWLDLFDVQLLKARSVA